MSRERWHDIPELLEPEDMSVQSRYKELLDDIFKPGTFRELIDTPRNFSEGQYLISTIDGLEWTDIAFEPLIYGCRYYETSFTLATHTIAGEPLATEIGFAWSIDWDTDSYFNGVASDLRIPFGRDGTYRILFETYYEANGGDLGAPTGWAEASLYINGGEIQRRYEAYVNVNLARDGAPGNISVANPYNHIVTPLLATDTVSCQLYHYCGDPADVDVRLSLIRLGDTP